MYTNYISRAFKLCSTGEEEFNLSYNSLTSERAKHALAERTKNKIFANTLFWAEPMGEEKDEGMADGNGEGFIVEYDETDSSETLDLSGL
jgi:hypothetical protein